MNLIAKIALSTIIPRIINEVWGYITDNKEQLIKTPAKKIKTKIKHAAGKVRSVQQRIHCPKLKRRKQDERLKHD